MGAYRDLRISNGFTNGALNSLRSLAIELSDISTEVRATSSLSITTSSWSRRS